jgi:hypothetical protein
MMRRTLICQGKDSGMGKILQIPIAWLGVGIYAPSLRSKSFYKFLDDFIFICLDLLSILQLT